jgi:hypothetical protein
MSASSITRLNDAFRTSFTGGQILFTSGIAGLPFLVQAGILQQVRAFSDFTEDNDPHGEHDFGALDIPAVGKVFWKIDYYDLTMQSGSEDPADPAQTRRVLTIMLAEEY